MQAPYNLNLMYLTVVVLDKVELIAQINFQIYCFGVDKINIKTYNYIKCIQMYKKFVEIIFQLSYLE